MTLAEFEKQVNRLRDNYGDRYFSDEKLRIFFNEVKTFSSSWFEQAVTKVIATKNMAPTISDFWEEIAKERERVYAIQKSQNSRDAKEGWNNFQQGYGNISNESKAHMCKAIVELTRPSTTPERRAAIFKLIHTIVETEGER
jgi:hypothetical protein